MPSLPLIKINRMGLTDCHATVAVSRERLLEIVGAVAKRNQTSGAVHRGFRMPNIGKSCANCQTVGAQYVGRTVAIGGL